MQKVNLNFKIDKEALDDFRKLVKRHEIFLNQAIVKVIYFINEMESDCAGGESCIFEGLEKKKYIKKLNEKGYYKKGGSNGIH